MIPPKFRVANFENSVTLSTEDENGNEINGAKICRYQGRKSYRRNVIRNISESGFDIKNGEYVFRFEESRIHPKKYKPI